MLDMTDSSLPRNPVPFYGSYASFLRAMTALKEKGIPRRLNARSLGSIMGDEGRRISTHFISMGWVDQDDKPTEELVKLVGAFGTDSWKETLTSAVRRVYAFVPEPWEDLKGEQLHEAFSSHTQRGAQVMTQAETFFLSLALECGLPLSDRLYFRAERAHSLVKKRSKDDDEPENEIKSGRKIEPKKLSSALAENVEVPEVRKPIPIDMILKLSGLLAEGNLTDQERKAIGLTISILGRMNAA